MVKHITVIVTGKVQGVYYRASAANMAKELGVRGWIENRPDGSVYIEAEASPEVLDQFVAWCKKGPASARVDQCIVTHAEVVNFKEFSIQR